MYDKYPTRKYSTYSIINRKERVAFDRPKNFTESEFKSYNRDGFIVLKGFFNNLESIKRLAESVYDGKTKCYTNHEPNIKQVRSALGVHDFKEIEGLLTDSLKEIVSSLLGDSIYIHQSRINYKAGSNSNGWNWHSDFETWHSQDGMPEMKCLTAMIPLDNNTIENGCLKVIKGSQNKFISAPKVGGVNPEDEFSEQVEGVPSEEILNGFIEQFGVYDVCCEVGDLVLFDCNILHGSEHNKTEGKRTNLYFVFNSYENRLVAPFSGKNHRPQEMGNLTPEKL